MQLGVTADELIYEKAVRDFSWRLQDNRTLHILHFNDVYDLDPMFHSDPIGGAARFATLMDFVQRQLLTTYGCHPLILFSGDFAGPSLMSTVTKGAHMIEMLNLLGVHCATFGNHELDYGYENLKGLLRGSTEHPSSVTQWVMTNIKEKGSQNQFGGEGVHETLLFDWNGTSSEGHSRFAKQSIRVGILAVSENWLNKHRDEFDYTDHIKAAKDAAESLKSRGAEIVLALTHSRYANDFELSKAVIDIDLILGGHDHDYKSDINNRIVKSGEEWRWLSYVTVNTKSKGIKLTTYNTSKDISPSPRVEVLCDLYRQQCEKMYGNELTQTHVELDPTERCVRFGNSVLANWMCDACLNGYRNENIQVCILPAFCFSGKDIIPMGKFTLGNLHSILAAGVVELVILNMSGTDIKYWLMDGAKKLPDESARLMHVSSGFYYEITCNEDRSVEISKITLHKEDVDPEKIYTVIMPYTLVETVCQRVRNDKIGGRTQDQHFEGVAKDSELTRNLFDLFEEYCPQHPPVQETRITIIKTLQTAT